MRPVAILLLGAVTGLLPAIGIAAAAPNCIVDADSATRIEACFDDGLLDLDARGKPLRSVLGVIATASGLELQVADGAATEIGDWKLRRQPLMAAIRQLLGCHGWVLSGHRPGGDAAATGGNLQVLACSTAAEASPAGCNECTVPETHQAAVPEALAERLVGALFDDGPRAARGNVAAIESLAPAQAVVALERGFGIADPGIRMEVVAALGRLGDTAAIRALAQAALGDSDPAVRRSAMVTLAANGSPQARTLLRAALNSNDQPTRDLAAQLLGEPPPATFAPAAPSRSQRR